MFVRSTFLVDYIKTLSVDSIKRQIAKGVLSEYVVRCLRVELEKREVSSVLKQSIINKN